MAGTSSMPVIYSGVNYSLLQSALQPLLAPSYAYYASYTSLPVSSTVYGTAIVQAVGSGTAAYLTISVSGSSYTVCLNACNALASGALYEFGLTVAPGDSIQSISGATLIRVVLAWR